MPLGIGWGKQAARGAGADAFAAEVERLRLAAVPGESGRLRELFDFLADRGPDAESASQAEMAERVFGQADTEGDDATVRVYIHRLRKRLDDFYTGEGGDRGKPRLVLPAGTYALRLQDSIAAGACDEDTPETVPVRRGRRYLPMALGLAVLLLAGGFMLGRFASAGSSAPPANELWQPFLKSQRPTLIVLGDYYIYGEIDPVRPEEGRLIRDFRVNSPTDLVRMQDADPEHFGNAEDVGLNYLPFSSAYGMQNVIPILTRGNRQISILPASELQPDMLNYFDVIYIGLFSGMHLLEDVNFMNSNFQLGESYDELIHVESGKNYVSEEARRLASPVYYRDYGYVARFRAPSGALVAIIAGARDTGLRGIAPLAAAPALAPELEEPAAKGADFEAVYQITGQQGADLSERLVSVQQRP
ncbi:hypothetical protein FHS61_000542 [Altererythrobacter atlanticus]|uniref:Uncharacterized protein n=1 Tax=Croceibacterium atlanticum TaxID=1267766 RepID=A0A0F7KQG4_9SPHN|nr:hypothetical protein [Croceibacterium atlanticum]AKH42768.1 hypothetical protein WYH_01732 [Croceibacterium atlanticum]MBB5731549.1 hypothetical protein [Croceibacterium atlanticum]